MSLIGLGRSPISLSLSLFPHHFAIPKQQYSLRTFIQSAELPKPELGYFDGIILLPMIIKKRNQWVVLVA